MDYGTLFRGRRSYLRDQARVARLRAVGAFVLGVGATVLVATGGGPLGAALVVGTPPRALAFGVAVLLVTPWIAFALAWRAAGRAARFGAGARGEDALERTLRRHLGDEWTLYRNLCLPGWRADLDGVLLGPPGLVLLENKAYRGEFVIFGDRWYQAAQSGGRDLRAWRGSPTAQAARNGQRLAEWLVRSDPSLAAVPIQAVVVLSSGRIREQHHPSLVPVVALADLGRYLTALPRARGLDRERRAALTKALDVLNDGGARGKD